MFKGYFHKKYIFIYYPLIFMYKNISVKIILSISGCILCKGLHNGVLEWNFKLLPCTIYFCEDTDKQNSHVALFLYFSQTLK